MRWLSFENALRNVLGLSVRGLASSYERNKQNRKKDIREWITKMKKQCADITHADARLRDMVLSDLDNVQKSLNRVGSDPEAEWDMIAKLLMLSSRLVGFDWLDGKIHRSVIYYQTQLQENTDLKNRELPKKELIFECLDRYEKSESKIVQMLRADGYSLFEIHNLIKISKRRLQRLVTAKPVISNSKPRRSKPKTSKTSPQHTKQPKN